MTTTTTNTLTKHAEQWREQGYLHLRGVIDARRVAELYEACESAYAQWRQHSTPENQPGGFAYGPRGWVLLHLNHPRYHREHPRHLVRLLEMIADPLAVSIMREIFGEQPLFGQANYYVDTARDAWRGIWHRDCQFFAKGDEQIERRMVTEEAHPPREMHMHIPLVRSAATEVVPGSHTRWDSDEELRVRRHDAENGAMPGAVLLHLNPGDLAFFHVNALHRGLYGSSVPRRTIAVTYGAASRPRAATAESMKTGTGYVATYQPWFLRDDYLAGVGEEARRFFRQFIDVYRDSWKPEYLAELRSELREYFTSESNKEIRP